MRIHSDKLTRQDMFEALPSGVIISEGPSVRGSRSHARAFEVRLSGSSPYAQQGGTGYKAATWDEHGVWMARLYDIDPFARISWYRDKAHFYAETQRAFEHPGNQLGRRAQFYTAPWLRPDFDAERRAEALGYDAGKAAGSWVIDGNTSVETALTLLRGIEDGDPMTMDSLPSSPLSGEWADGSTPRTVLAELGMIEDDGEPDDDDIIADAIASADDVLMAYETGYSSGVVDEVLRSARAIMPDVRTVYPAPVAYTFEADTHCPACTARRFGVTADGMIPADATDNEGNGIGAIAPWDEWEGPLYCGTCHGKVRD